MYLLDLATGKPFFDVQIQAHEPKHHADRLAVFVRGLDGELQDKSGAADGVNVQLVVRGANGARIEIRLTKEWCGCAGPAGSPRCQKVFDRRTVR